MMEEGRKGWFIYLLIDWLIGWLMNEWMNVTVVIVNLPYWIDGDGDANPRRSNFHNRESITRAYLRPICE
jgi:hypothetical protein